jgi:hypothetical protein
VLEFRTAGATLREHAVPLAVNNQLVLRVIRSLGRSKSLSRERTSPRNIIMGDLGQRPTVQLSLMRRICACCVVVRKRDHGGGRRQAGFAQPHETNLNFVHNLTASNCELGLARSSSDQFVGLAMDSVQQLHVIERPCLSSAYARCIRRTGLRRALVCDCTCGCPQSLQPHKRPCN